MPDGPCKIIMTFHGAGAVVNLKCLKHSKDWPEDQIPTKDCKDAAEYYLRKLDLIIEHHGDYGMGQAH